MTTQRLLQYILFAVLLAACSSNKHISSTLPPTKSVEALTTNIISLETVIDNFEAATTTWKPGTLPDYTDSSAVGVALSKDYASQGQGSLALSFQKNEKPKALFALEGQFDASQAHYLAFDLNDPQGAVAAVGIAICTGNDWYWHESAPFAIQKGANSQAFDLTASVYKTAASNWELTSTIANRQDVKRFVVILYPTNNGAVYLDHFRLLPAGSQVASLPTAEPQALATVTAGQGNGASANAPCPGKTALPESNEPLVLSVASTAPAARYELIELDIQTNVHPKNPYDPAEIDLQLNVTAPDGSHFTIPAFWFQNFDPATAAPCGQPGWKARLTPTQEGQWTVQAEVVGQGLTSQPLHIAVAGSSSPGFVRVSSKNPAYFAFDDGSTFFPVGLNLGWWQSSPLEDYARWMDRLSANGGTLIRVWMAAWSFGIEWNDTGLGNYDKRQYQAWLLDQLFQMARRRGIYIELVLLNHGAFSQTTNPEWDNNPYNAALGGPLQSPAEFATDASARQLFQRRLRYIASRWGYSTQLFAWEWWNEVNWTPITPDNLAAWVVDMTGYLKSLDPYHHLVSLSYAGGGWPQVLGLPEIDFVQHHEYTNNDPMIDFRKLLEWDTSVASGKPVLFAEFGYSAGIEDKTSFDQQGLHLHNGLWAATFSGYASPAMYWWWDTYIDPLNLWGQIGSLTSFLKGEDLAQLAPLPAEKASLSDVTAYVLALGSDQHLLAWVRNANYNAFQAQTTLNNDINSRKTPAADWRYQLEPLSGLRLTVTGLKDGTYRVQWYDPSTSQWLAESSASVQGGMVTLDVPTFSFDLALKLEFVK